MKRLWWPLLILVICLPVALLALGVDIPGLSPGRAGATPLPVPDGDFELAYLDYATNAAAWERLVTGVERLKSNPKVPGVTVNDAAAFLPSTTATPEVVVSREGHAARLRIRWYKLSQDARTADWVAALAERHPAPLAVIGGGTTQRAEEVAEALAQQTTWDGPRPPLAITTATAEIATGVPLLKVYEDRTFRFCFDNRQMAKAVVEFACDAPDLALMDFADLGRRAACPLFPPAPFRPTVLSAIWRDDSYSIDLQDRFASALLDRFPPAPDGVPGVDHVPTWVTYSAGRADQPNAEEALGAVVLADEFRKRPPQRAVLVLPTSAAPARRFLRTVLEANRDAAKGLVVLTGDGIPMNAVLRDGEFAWPTGQLNVPLILFTHADPVAWDPTDHPSGYTLRRPAGTEDAMHLHLMARIFVEACLPAGGATVADANELIDRLRDTPAKFDAPTTAKFFGDKGRRLDGTGEHVVVVRPVERAEVPPDERWYPGEVVVEVRKRDGAAWGPPTVIKFRRTPGELP